ncbi:MAG: glucosamine-6-phosphate isomerase [Actinomycetota bacterium]|nr:glucosamine-6-phosphate isomerase [Actinomycetota bacterium]
MRNMSKISPEWWDYTTLDEEILKEAEALTPVGLKQLSRDGFRIHFYDSLKEFFLAEALEYIGAWSKATPDNPAGICGPVGPVEQLPLVAMLVNEMELNLSDAHFWGMDEWYEGGKPVDFSHPLSFVRTDMDLCFTKIRKDLVMPEENIHFPVGSLDEYSRSFSEIRCVVMQGGQGESKHWAFNEPFRRKPPYEDEPPSVEEYRSLEVRILELHPLTIIQNARTSAGGNASIVPKWAATVGPKETWKAERVSIWHPGYHDGPLGIKLTAMMVSRGIIDTAVPMSVLAEHRDVHFHIYKGAIIP